MCVCACVCVCVCVWGRCGGGVLIFCLQGSSSSGAGMSDDEKIYLQVCELCLSVCLAGCVQKNCNFFHLQVCALCLSVWLAGCVEKFV